MNKRPSFTETFRKSLETRYQPIYDNTFDDLLKKLDQIPVTSDFRKRT